ncbi:S66 peptidase family protein [Fusobacterium mortiferum]|uniref:LD-carboxypeptidase n=1 Tax=Fusobacterium mortiferum TaxID=850 RepID=A0ABS2G1U2_FUSMR|nr:LD-carboxypeptidase [Fusobacterium mortiferum]MBM6875366.1 LD-carboxypeptidase [Fusobacterium mortiferum]
MLGKKLKKGDTIGIIAPASCTTYEKVLEAKKNIEDMGYQVILGECTKKQWYSYAGTDEERAEEINSFFADKNIDAIICMRGGYGCNRLIELLDFEVIKRNPKIFVGYSDITTLHIALNGKANLITFHGPMAVSNFTGNYNRDTYENFIEMLSNSKDEQSIKNIIKELKVLNEGRAKGKLVGGNLATLIATLGTEYDLDYNGKILFLEDVGEKTYKIDRFLNQLKKHGVFEKIEGLVLGDFKNCIQDSEKDMTLLEVFQNYFKELKKPVIYNFESGHSEPMLTLPLGAICEIDTYNKELKVLERVVSE